MKLKAPTGSNGQNWEFVVVKDRAVKEQLARRYRQAWRLYGGMGERTTRGNESMAKILRAVKIRWRDRGNLPAPFALGEHLVNEAAI